MENWMARKGKLSLDDRARQRVDEDNPHLEYVRLDRRQICENEIISAIRIFLFYEDPISAHVLSSAANEIMSALSKGAAGVGLNDMRAFLKENAVAAELQEELFASLQHPYNFLKHSSADMAIENSFSIDYIVMGLYTACHGYKALFGTMSTEMSVFYGMVGAWRVRHWWPDDPNFQLKLDAAERMGLIDLTWQEFCAKGREVLTRVLQEGEATVRQ